eukprot:m.479275 g.479275  ORF g.479275 m.479275 type:complete len:100 (-) comp21698_c0_seq12:2010-2309(-)
MLSLVVREPRPNFELLCCARHPAKEGPQSARVLALARHVRNNHRLGVMRRLHLHHTTITSYKTRAYSGVNGSDSVRPDSFKPHNTPSKRLSSVESMSTT